MNNHFNQYKYNKSLNVCPLYRALSKLSFCSRKDAKNFIINGYVSVNNKIIKEILYPVNLDNDVIKVKNEQILKKAFEYIAFIKPKGYETSKKPSIKNSKIIYELLPDSFSHLKPIGRLDKESRGLIILTNDNEFLNLLSGDNSNIPKHYIVKTNFELTTQQLIEFQNGINIKHENKYVKTKPCVIKYIDKKTYEIILTQGLNRQIRKMFQYFNIDVIDLLRYKIGKLQIDINLVKEGSYFNILPNDVI